MVDEVAWTVSVIERIGRPCRPPTEYATSHHSWVSNVSEPVRISSTMPSRAPARPRVCTPNGIQRTEPSTTKNTELPLSDPHVVTISA